MPSTIQRLNSRHYKILELCLRGWTAQQIASHLGMNPSSISLILRSPSFQHELAARKGKYDDLVDQSLVSADDEVTRAIKEHTLAAVRRIGLVINSPSASNADALRASSEILDRGGYPKTQRSETRSLQVVIDQASAKRIADTISMENNDKAGPPIEDASPERVDSSIIKRACSE